MVPLDHDLHFTFHCAEDRLIPRFHLEGVEARRRVSVFKLDPATDERLGLIAKATVGDGGWVDLPEPIIGLAGGGLPHARYSTAPSCCPFWRSVVFAGCSTSGLNPVTRCSQDRHRLL